MKNYLGQRLRESPGPLLLTGHTGFKGTWMTFLLEQLGVPVIGYSLKAEQNTLFERANRIGSIKETFADVRDYATLSNFMDTYQPSTIIHMAAQPLVLKSYENPRETFDVNVMGTVNVLDIAIKKEYVKAIIIVTTDKVYRNDNTGNAFLETDPLEGKDPYSASKVGTESVVSAWKQITKIFGGPNITSVRAGNVIGGGDFAQDRLIPDLVRAIISGESVEIRQPDSTRPWQHVIDSSIGYVKALEYSLLNPNTYAFNFAPIDQSLRVREIVSIFANAFEGPNNLEVKLLPTEKYSSKNNREALNLRLNSELSKQVLDWQPQYSQKKSIEETALWWKKTLVDKEDPGEVTKLQIKQYLETLQ
jgi:CDP-glucose 4,6-dehydratase